MATIINATGVKKYFGKERAVDSLDLRVEAGTILGLIGPNGAGKTTLLRSLLGLCDCEGQLDVLGFDPRYERSKMLDQVCSIADTAVLPLISDHQGKFTGITIGVNDVTTDPDLHLSALLFGNSNQRHLPVIINLGKAHQHLQ